MGGNEPKPGKSLKRKPFSVHKEHFFVLSVFYMGFPKKAFSHTHKSLLLVIQEGMNQYMLLEVIQCHEL
ncbi:hypothetical protein AYK26_03185 [Euryarchaeota archaeon SM23-78]|nr:MAG: hypothetical protein AYK26_03185 [Euryarchaeota archaeon SM23-78]